MNKYILLVLLASILIACESKVKDAVSTDCFTAQNFSFDACPDSGTCAFFVFPAARLVRQNLDENQLIMNTVEGENLVFSYKFTSTNPRKLPETYEEVILFEVNSDVDKFNWTTKDLKQKNVYFGKLCRCVNGGFHKIESGCIKGEKLTDGSWLVQFSLMVKLGAEETIQKNISATFMEGELGSL